MQLTSGQRARLALPHSGQPDGDQQTLDVDRSIGGQAPDHVIGHPDPQNLAFRALQHQGGAATPTQPGFPRPGERARRGGAPRQQLDQGGLSGAVVAHDGQEFAGVQGEVDAGERGATGARVPETDLAQRHRKRSR